MKKSILVLALFFGTVHCMEKGQKMHQQDECIDGGSSCKYEHLEPLQTMEPNPVVPPKKKKTVKIEQPLSDWTLEDEIMLAKATKKAFGSDSLVTIEKMGCTITYKLGDSKDGEIEAFLYKWEKNFGCKGFFKKKFTRP